MCGGSGIGKSRFCWELGKVLAKEMQTKSGVDVNGTQYPFNTRYSFMYISTEFAGKGGIRTKTTNLNMQVFIYLF